MKILKLKLFVVSALTFIQGFWVLPVWSDGGYFTTYSHHIEKGELEMMFMADFTSPSDLKREQNGHGEYFSQMFELEYAPTHQLAFEFMLEGFEDVENGEAKFTGFRYEARYRLFEQDVPLNPMIYAEYEDLHLETRYKMEVSGWVDPPYEEEAGDESDRERIFESRFILSQDLGRFNAAFNWINESDLHSGDTAFGYSTGVLYRLHEDDDDDDKKESCHKEAHKAQGGFVRPMSLAFELFGALGDTIDFGLKPSRQEHYFQPSLMCHAGDHAMVTLGFAFGLSKASDDLVRLMWGWEF